MVTLPSEKDFRSPETGKWVEKYFKANPDIPTENRMRILRLIENISPGYGGSGLSDRIPCMEQVLPRHNGS